MKVGIKHTKKTLESLNCVNTENSATLERIKTSEDCQDLYIQLEECSGQFSASGKCKGSCLSSLSEASLNAVFRKRVIFARLFLIESQKDLPCLAWHGQLSPLPLLSDLWFAQRGNPRYPGPRSVTLSGELSLHTVPWVPREHFTCGPRVT